MPVTDIGVHAALSEEEILIALAGHPNVGKSTVFNALTGLHQHTGNWAGKTVANAFGRCEKGAQKWLIADLPGCGSLSARSAEERIARDFICFEQPDVIVAVCSAVSLERGIGLVLQILELTGRVVVCVNLLDEARRKGIYPELELLEKRLGVPVVGASARSGKGLDRLTECIERMSTSEAAEPRSIITYPAYIESAVARLTAEAAEICPECCPARWLALRSLDDDSSLFSSISDRMSGNAASLAAFERRRRECALTLERQGISSQAISDDFSQAVADSAKRICQGVVPDADTGYSMRDRRLDRFLTGRLTGLPVMLVLLAVLLWITLIGANFISGWLSSGFNALEAALSKSAEAINMPLFWRELLLSGAFRVLGWVVAVMLPPMAIFFPLFTLLEDVGYLPRVAFNLDGALHRCGACGKQALTMCMGLGCNSAGVVGCRIIASPRERLLAILTNSFMPCNGRFPTLLAIISIFLAGSAGSVQSALILAGFVVLAVAVTVGVSGILSCTVLKGHTSAFSLELPPFRRPQILQTLVRSLADRTLTILGRAVIVALPAGVAIWLLANVTCGGQTLLGHITRFFEPAGQLMGLDGVTLTAFILGFPANELVLPVAMMAYSAQGELSDVGSMQSLGSLLTANGWDWSTAVSMLLFTLMHWPCSTTCITVYKETSSIRWTLLAFALPTACGFVCCTLFTTAVNLLS